MIGGRLKTTLLKAAGTDQLADPSCLSRIVIKFANCIFCALFERFIWKNTEVNSLKFKNVWDDRFLSRAEIKIRISCFNLLLETPSWFMIVYGKLKYLPPLRVVKKPNLAHKRTQIVVIILFCSRVCVHFFNFLQQNYLYQYPSYNLVILHMYVMTE